MPAGNPCRFATSVLRFGTSAAFMLGPAACGGEKSTGPGPGPGPGPSTAQMAKATPSGDNQAGRPGQALAEPLRVRITQGSQGVSGKTVTWQVTGGGGNVNPGASTTDGSGTATTSVTLGNAIGEITITANASDVSGGPVSFSALVAGPNATVQVSNNRFEPEVVAITAGGTVTFEWTNGSSQHNLIADGGKDRPNDPTLRDGPFQLPPIAFPTPGRYEYHCSNHGSAGSGMHGTIIVVP